MPISRWNDFFLWIIIILLYYLLKDLLNGRNQIVVNLDRFKYPIHVISRKQSCSLCYNCLLASWASKYLEFRWYVSWMSVCCPYKLSISYGAVTYQRRLCSRVLILKLNWFRFLSIPSLVTLDNLENTKQ